MNAKPFVKIFAGLAIVGAVGVAWMNWRAARQAETALSEITLKLNVAHGTTRRVEEQLALAERNFANMRSSLAKIQSAIVALNPSRGKLSGPRRPQISDRLQTEPAYQVLWLAELRSSLTRRYGPFMQKLGLSPTQVEKFHAAAIRREEQNMDVKAIMESQGLTGRDPTVIRLRAATEAEYATTQRELLGDEGYRELQDYDRTKWVREMVNGLAGGAVVVARAPLSAQQAEQLIQVIANATSSHQDSLVINTDTIDWDLVDAQAQGILSEAQFALYQTMEPPLPMGARFQSRLYASIKKANEADAASSSTNPKPDDRPME